MPFCVSEEQWASCSTAIAKMGGDATECDLRDELDRRLTRIFIAPCVNKGLVRALRLAVDAARGFQAAIELLASVEQEQAESSEDDWAEEFSLQSAQRAKFAKFLAHYHEGLEVDLDASDTERKNTKGGRPSEAGIASLCESVLILARWKGWQVEDSRGRTAEALVDLVVELVKCVDAAGFTHGRGRSAIVRAMAHARADQKAADGTRARLNAELDALGLPDPETSISGTSFLCSAPPKSD